MIRYILVDDEPKVLGRVKSKIDTIASDFDLKYINSYHSSKLASEEIKENEYDLLIVDFEMPVYNGIELSQKIAKDKKVIFLTSSLSNEKLIINRVDISGYLSKPFDVIEFQEILKNKIIGKIDFTKSFINNEYITIPLSTNNDIGFTPNETFYITSSLTKKGNKSNKNNVNFYTKNDDIYIENVRITIDNLYTILEPYGFEKINQSTIINISKVAKRFNKIIELKNCNEEFTISESEKPGFIKKIRSLFGA